MLCPNGHDSAATDWCEICGMRMPAPPSSAYGSRPPSSSASSSSTPPVSPQPAVGYGPAGAGAAGPAQLCPACGTPREGMALFCEECRYNFHTHSATTFVPPAPHFTPPAPDQPPYQRYDSQLSRPSRVNRPAEQLPPESVTVTSGSGDFMLDPPSTPTAPPAGTGAAGARTAAPGNSGIWTAVIAADREYFTAVMARSGPDASGLYFPAFSPEVELPLTGHQVTIGRQRHSTGEAPDIDLSRSPEDPGVSHKHAVLVQQPDGSWSVVDQDSTNGTTVNLAEDPIPAYTPIPLAEGDRIHVGAWTTITVRRV